jgi:hypothetical protein
MLQRQTRNPAVVVSCRRKPVATSVGSQAATILAATLIPWGPLPAAQCPLNPEQLPPR